MTVRPEDVQPRFFWRRLPERVWFRGAIGVLALLLLALAARELWWPLGPAALPERPPSPPREAAPALPSPLAGLNADLDAATAAYWQRRGDFDLGLIGCELLAAGYGGADEAFVAAARVFGRLGAAAGPDAEEVAEFRRLTARMDSVNAHFDAAGCPRPR